MSFFNSVDENSSGHEVNKYYSSDPEVKEMQLKAEQLNIFEIIKNIANHGDDTKDEANIIEWEECKLAYKKQKTNNDISTSIQRGISLAFNSLEKEYSVSNKTYLTMKDGTVLFFSECRNYNNNIGTKEYITAFRNGKWVDRIKAYSDKLTKQHKQSLIEQKNKEKERKLAPFSEIDF